MTYPFDTSTVKIRPGLPLSMNAGRELDALVAEKVMGFHWVDEWQGQPGPYLVSPHGYLAGWRRDDGGITAHLDGVTPDVVLPNYSTDIAAAWEVVENLADRGWKVDVQNRYYPCWAVHVHFPVPDYRNVFETSELLVGAVPFAICLAALKAVGA